MLAEPVCLPGLSGMLEAANPVEVVSVNIGVAEPETSVKLVSDYAVCIL